MPVRIRGKFGLRCGSPANNRRTSYARRRASNSPSPIGTSTISVQGADRSRVRIVVGRISNETVPQRIVDRDQAAGPNELQAMLVIRIVIFLVGIDEREIEAALLPCCAQARESLGSGRAPQLDGSYAHVGRAQGPWDAIAEGDVVTSIRVK